jgi:hypothetical protein
MLASAFEYKYNQRKINSLETWSTFFIFLLNSAWQIFKKVNFRSFKNLKIVKTGKEDA